MKKLIDRIEIGGIVGLLIGIFMHLCVAMEPTNVDLEDVYNKAWSMTILGTCVLGIGWCLRQIYLKDEEENEEDEVS